MWDFSLAEVWPPVRIPSPLGEQQVLRGAKPSQLIIIFGIWGSANRTLGLLAACWICCVLGDNRPASYLLVPEP